MATNFPTALDTFTARSDGQTIDAAHVNDLQDAVAAVQAKVGADGSAAPTSLDYRVDALESAAGGGAPEYDFTPVDYGFKAWSIRPESLDGEYTAVGSGTMFAVRVRLPAAATITNLHILINTGGTGVSRSVLALYNSSFNLIAQTADAGSSFGTVGLKTLALTAPQSVAAGDYYVAWWQVYSSSPGKLIAHAPASSQIYRIPQHQNFGRMVNTASTGLTTTAPASFTVSGYNGFTAWGAVS